MSRADGRVGVVILTHDRPRELAETLERMAALPERPTLVVVDNGATTDGDLTVRFPDVEVLRLPRNLGAAGRNAGAAMLTTPYVAFCDDDTWWEPGALARAADLLDEDPRLGLVTGKVLVGPDGHVDPTCLEMARSPLPAEPGLPGPAVLGFLCAASVVRRRMFLRIGGFEPRFFLGGEEALLAIDVAASGYALAYVDEIVVHHHPSTRRESRRRHRLLLRNALWCAWLRRPAASALRLTLATARAHLRDPDLTAVRASAAAGAAWVARHRRVVPPQLEWRLRSLEEQRVAH